MWGNLLIYVVQLSVKVPFYKKQQTSTTYNATLSFCPKCPCRFIKVRTTERWNYSLLSLQFRCFVHLFNLFFSVWNSHWDLLDLVYKMSPPRPISIFIHSSSLSLSLSLSLFFLLCVVFCSSLLLMLLIFISFDLLCPCPWYIA